MFAFKELQNKNKNSKKSVPITKKWKCIADTNNKL